MLDYFLAVDKQILIMFLMIAVGYILQKKHMLTEEGSKDMSQLLLKIVTPMILITSFQRIYDGELLKAWCIMFGLAVLSYIILILAATLFYKNKSNPHWAENRLSLAFPNNGFMAIPLMQALAGDIGVFFGAANIIILNILFWTYGARTLQPGEKINLRQIFLNPGLISVICGLLLFCSPWKLPEPIFDAMSSLGSLNTPLAMIVLGGFLAQTDLKSSFKTPAFYKLCGIKLIFIPLVMMVILYFLPVRQDIKLITFMCSVTPTATAVSMLSQIYHKDYRFCSGAIVITTLLSAATIPVMMTLAKGVLG